MDSLESGLSRFTDAQAPIYGQVRAELVAGRKTSHWMWFVFPQLRALGRSTTSQHYGLEGVAEARAYWQHPLLGQRLAQCCGVLLAAQGRTALEVFGSVDAMKLRSCMTLFDVVAPEAKIFRAMLEKYFHGEPDPATCALLADAT